MFGKHLHLFKIFGFSVRVDLSWVIIAALVSWSLASGVFPQHYENLPISTYWLMGLMGALGLFASIIFHELSHSLVARRYGLAMKGITLFIFGGVAEMEDEPRNAKTEFMMAVAGPASSVALAIFFYLLSRLGISAAWPLPLSGVVSYLIFINLILAIFNLIPAFPLDGGRILRAVLWSWKDNIKWATRVASWIGSGFGLVLIMMGALRVLAGDFVGGMWSFLIGMFLRGAARMSYKQLITRQALQGQPVSRFMEPNPVIVPPSITIKDLVENYIYRYNFEMFPVIEGGRVFGCISTSQIKGINPNEWARRTVGELVTQCSPENTIPFDADSIEALSKMSRSGASRLMVLDGNRLIGLVSMKDMLRFLSLKADLEEK